MSNEHSLPFVPKHQRALHNLTSTSRGITMYNPTLCSRMFPMRRKPSYSVTSVSGAALALLCLAATGCGGADVATPDEPATSPVGAVQDALNIVSVNDLWASGSKIDACFIPAGLDVQKQLIRDNVYRTWEFVANIGINWLASCPPTGSLIRLAISTDVSKGTAGWTIGLGVHAKKNETASNGASIKTCEADGNCPSSKYFLADPPRDPDRTAYLAVHEWGHVLGFDEELDHPSAVDSCDVGSTHYVATPHPSNDPVTTYDHESIMNYCNSAGNGKGYVDGLDIAGIQSLYGIGPRYYAAIASLP